MSNPEATDGTIEDTIKSIEKFLASQRPTVPPEVSVMPPISEEGLQAWQRENTPHGLAPFARLAELLPAARRERQFRERLILTIGMDREWWQGQAIYPLPLPSHTPPARAEWGDLARPLTPEGTGVLIYIPHDDPLNGCSLVSSLTYERRRDNSVTYKVCRKHGHEVILAAALFHESHRPMVCRRTEFTLCHRRPKGFVDQSLAIRENPHFPNTTLLAFEEIAFFVLQEWKKSGKESNIASYPL